MLSVLLQTQGVVTQGAVRPWQALCAGVELDSRLLEGTLECLS